MIPRNFPLFVVCQFVPIILLLGVSLGLGCLAGFLLGGDNRVLCLTFLAVYYALYFLLFRTFNNPNNYNDNTSGVATVLSLMERIGTDKVAYILFDNEEKGKKGSKAYRNDHKEMTENKLFVNFDCVGNGENFVFIAMQEAEKSESYARLCESFTASDRYTVSFYPIKGSESNSDYKNFPCGVGCMACKKGKRTKTLYTPRIHTPRDVVASAENVEFLVEGMRRFVDVC